MKKAEKNTVILLTMLLIIRQIETELADLNAKLKKTISERDLLIREYKSVKDKSSKMEETIKSSNADSDAAAVAHKKELKKLQDQLTAIENASKASGKGDKEKDKLIGVSGSLLSLLL